MMKINHLKRKIEPYIEAVKVWGCNGVVWEYGLEILGNWWAWYGMCGYPLKSGCLGRYYDFFSPRKFRPELMEIFDFMSKYHVKRDKIYSLR